ncbi:AAA family ATPase [Chloroflexia bacterium SDU3-3]|nr:AAA family ATPase [Chloroflexia bacterium SDU3-3]
MTHASNADPMSHIQRPPAESLYADEMARLAAAERGAPRPQGWRLTPRSVLSFVLGDERLGISPKFVGSRSLVERCVVSLATNRGLMLIGEPGTAKSYLSELLAAAISGDSTLIIQGSAGTTEDAIKYSWNYALLLAEGPNERSLVPAPLYRGMSEGKVVRFEEITRCPLEIQDTLLSILSDRVMAVPEREDAGRVLFATVGFNIIATANTRDRGVNEMSAALKRRFNFETIPPIQDIRQEMRLVQRETERLLQRSGVPVALPPDLAELLVTTFHELRSGKTAEGKGIDPLSSVMSTAEAVSVGYAACVHAYYYAGGKVAPSHLMHSLLGSALKDTPEDREKLQHYLTHVVKERKGAAWRAFYEARQEI